MRHRSFLFSRLGRELTAVAILLVAVLVLWTSCGDGSRSADGNEATDVVERLKQQYSAARELQQAERYDEAIAAFDKCLATEVPDGVPADSVLPVIADALVQLVNTYQFKGAPEPCVAHLERYRQKSSAFVRNYALRDLYIVLAYAVSRTDSTSRAEALADSAMAMELTAPTPERLFRDYAYAAAVCYSNPARQQQVVDWCKQALEQARQCDNTSGAQYVTSMLGSIYKRNGKLPEALDLYLASREEAHQHGDLLGEAVACNALTELHLYWRIPTYADSYATAAVEHCERAEKSNPMIQTQALLLKGQVKQALQRPDSAVYFYHKAEEVCRDLPYTCGRADVDYFVGSYYVTRLASTDTIARGEKRLLRVMADGTPLLRSKAFYAMGMLRMKQGRDAEANAYLDSTYTLLHSFTPPQYIDLDYDALLKYYVGRHDRQRSIRTAADLVEAHNADANVVIRTRMYENIVKLRTAAAEQQVETERLARANERLTYIYWLVALVGVVLVLTMWIIYRRKLYRSRQKVLETKLFALLDKMEAVRHERELAKKEREQANKEREQANKEREQAERALALAKSSDAAPSSPIPAGVLHDDGEAEFRQRFEHLYPQAIPNLRERIPDLGRREELHCMLIYLGQDTHQAALILGINYRSANMARYRLRRKLGLETDDSLEDTLKAIIEK